MLAILTSHPIQYQAPLWRALAVDGQIPFEVWFLTDHAVKPTHDREFAKSFAWDQDLLAAYPHRFLPVREGWRMDRFRGIRLVESWGVLFKRHNITHLWVEGWRFLENWTAVFAARRAGIKVWMRGETNDLKPRRGLKGVLRRLLLRRLFAKVDQFLCIGTANRRFYQSFGISENRLNWAPYSVENQYFHESGRRFSHSRNEIRSQYLIPEEAACFLFCGKFIGKKRPLDLVAAAQLAMSTEPGRPLHLLFVGSGMLGEELRRKCRVVYDEENPLAGSSSAHPSASFAGFLNQSEIGKAYAAADCLVLPSDTGETWGLVANEAMASGLPCIVSKDCGCAEDLVAGAPNSATYPCGDVNTLKELLLEFHPGATTRGALQVHMMKFDSGLTVEAAGRLWKNR
jgi:glycosyltransferase involved in cell wall biosynthesis